MNLKNIEKVTASQDRESLHFEVHFKKYLGMGGVGLGIKMGGVQVEFIVYLDPNTNTNQL